MPQLGAVAIVGLAMSAAQTGMQVQAAKREAQNAANVAEFNARQQELAGQQAREAASVEASRMAKQGRTVMSAQRAAQAGSGLDMSTGTSKQLVDRTQNENRMDQLAMIYGGRINSAKTTSEAALLRASGKEALAGGKTAVAGTLLQGASSMGGQYAQARGY